MKGDFSRQTFQPAKHYSGVLMQQGRVQLDADWNEAQAALRYRDQTEAIDVIGSSGAPENLAGFAITAQDTTLSIGAGRYYVDGFLCENGTRNDPALLYKQQPDLPDAPDPVALLKGETNPFGLVYLDVWQRHITALDDPSIRESALGSDGPDTTTRIKNVWQVKVLPLTLDLTPLIKTAQSVQQELQNLLQTSTNNIVQATAKAASKSISDFMAGPASDSQSLEKVTALYGNVIAQLLLARQQLLKQSLAGLVDWQTLDQPILELEGSFLDFEASLPQQNFAEWTALNLAPTDTLKARVQPGTGQDDPCLIPPSSGYQLLENQLYRVEILQGGDPGKDNVTFAWSRDNGSVVTAITAPVNSGDTTVTVDSLGPDNELGFAKTQTVEILDDSLELNGKQGQLATIKDINSATLVVTLDKPLNAVSPQLHAKMRRWDGNGPVTLPANADDWIALEGGVQVQFAAGSYRTGDYWLIPARVGAGITWPTSPTDGTPLPQPPLGIRHHYSCLALLLLDQPTTVSISPGIIIHPLLFTLANRSSASQPSLNLSDRLLHSIGSSLSGGELAGLISLASTPSDTILRVWDCRALFPALATPPPAMHVIRTSWQNDSIMSTERFVTDGLAIVLDQTPDANSLVDGATMIVTLEVFTSQPSLPQGYTILNLIGTIQVLNNVIWWRLSLPGAATRAGVGMLRSTIPTARALEAISAVSLITQYRIRVKLQGHTIWQAGTWQQSARPYLDGQASGIPGELVEIPGRASPITRSGGGTPKRTMIDLLLPSGKGTRASDFESWFYLLPFEMAAFRVSTVNFLAVTNDTPEPTPVHSITVPPVPAATDTSVQFNVSDQINAIDVVFNRAVSFDGFRPDDLQKGLSLALTINAVTTLIVGTPTVKEDGVSVRFTEVDQQPLPEGSYQLTLISTGAAGPLVKSADDGTALDGNFDGQPGGDFVFPFSISTPIIIG